MRHVSNLPGGGGPYLREFSKRGITAVLGYATVDCNDSTMSSSSKGYMYLGAFGQLGYGSAIDAGLQRNSDSPTSSTEGGLQPFINIFYSGGVPAGGMNGVQGFKYGGSVRYGCNTAVGIMYGQLAGSSSNLMFAATGLPDYSPYDTSLPPATTVWSYTVWTIFPAPNDFMHPGTDALGFPTPCNDCIAKRMTTIAQGSVDFNSGECFGFCNGTIANRWDQTVMGQLETSCQAGWSTYNCSLRYATNGEWLGGFEQDPEDGRAVSSHRNGNDAFEGIKLVGGTSDGSPAGSFGPRQPYPGTNPPDDPGLQNCGRVDCIGNGG
jgi:hypothetical protein